MYVMNVYNVASSYTYAYTYVYEQIIKCLHVSIIRIVNHYVGDSDVLQAMKNLLL